VPANNSEYATNLSGRLLWVNPLGLAGAPLIRRGIARGWDTSMPACGHTRLQPPCLPYPHPHGHTRLHASIPSIPGRSWIDAGLEADTGPEADTGQEVDDGQELDTGQELDRRRAGDRRRAVDGR
jgi:hypothetical protein